MFMTSQSTYELKVVITLYNAVETLQRGGNTNL